MSVLKQNIFDFLVNIEQNNNREWFQMHKNEYQEAFNSIERFVDMLVEKIAVFDPSVSDIKGKNCIYRIYRDLRFSPDKRPYKEHIGAYIAVGGKTGNDAGYYIHFQNNNCMLACGMWGPDATLLKKIREEIYYEPQVLYGILNDKTFKKEWKTLDEETKLKRPPKNYPSDFQYIDLLMYRNFCALKFVSNKEVLSEDYLKKCTKAFEAGYPLVDYMNYLKKL